MVYLRHLKVSPRLSRQGGIYTLTGVDGKTLFEGELRQCIHCQYTWTHQPGSERLRGICLSCGGHTCGQPQCDTCYHKEKRVEDLEAAARKNRASINAVVRQQQLREQIAGYLRKKKGGGHVRLTEASTRTKT